VARTESDERAGSAPRSGESRNFAPVVHHTFFRQFLTKAISKLAFFLNVYNLEISSAEGTAADRDGPAGRLQPARKRYQPYAIRQLGGLPLGFGRPGLDVIAVASSKRLY
jgi:hypothetical protein